jgi:hypothetical protein
VSELNKRAKVLPVEALEKLGDSIFPIESEQSKTLDKANKESTVCLANIQHVTNIVSQTVRMKNAKIRRLSRTIK